jgi:hypothetical protein
VIDEAHCLAYQGARRGWNSRMLPLQTLITWIARPEPETFSSL